MGILLLGGGTVWFARTGKLNINIFPQNCWRAGEEVTYKFSGHTQKNFPHISQNLPLQHVIFAKIQKFFPGHIKIFPNFLSFARILHCFLPDRKNYAYIFREFFICKIILKKNRVTMTTTFNTSRSDNKMVLSARRGFLHACIF